MEKRLIALRGLRHAGRHVAAGHPFTADRSAANEFIRRKLAKLAPEDNPVPMGTADPQTIEVPPVERPVRERPKLTREYVAAQEAQSTDAPMGTPENRAAHDAQEDAQSTVIDELHAHTTRHLVDRIFGEAKRVADQPRTGDLLGETLGVPDPEPIKDHE